MCIFGNQPHKAQKKKKTQIMCTSLAGHVSLYYRICGLALAALLPAWALFEARDALAVLDTARVVSLIENGALHFAYNMCSFVVLGAVAPLTHEICNVARRVVVIVYSIIVFGNAVSPRSAAGITTVFVGIAWYTYEKARLGKQSATSVKKK
jgi:hypothetical protein